MLVLVVDDEPLIRDVVETALVDAGYAVITAGDAEQAIVALEADGSDFQALVTDVNLAVGKLTGWDVGRRARELAADLPVVYMTGDSGAEWTSHGVPHSILVAKPFAIGQIVTAVSQLLNAGGMHPTVELKPTDGPE
ncbi:MAG: response regulator [Sphingomonas sp.]|uniref:response regulator n=1 Tax=Sphingomonas sp. TaxID=28214 RepID=UPI0035613C2A